MTESPENSFANELATKAIAMGRKKYERFHELLGETAKDFDEIPNNLREAWIRLCIGGKIKNNVPKGVKRTPKQTKQPTEYVEPDWNKINKQNEANQKRVERALKQELKKNAKNTPL